MFKKKYDIDTEFLKVYKQIALITTILLQQQSGHLITKEQFNDLQQGLDDMREFANLFIT